MPKASAKASRVVLENVKIGNIHLHFFTFQGS